MMILPVRIEHALKVAVQCPHDADVGERERAAVLSRLRQTSAPPLAPLSDLGMILPR
jgi:hypothetical protein